jgi:hypothetical protein
MANHIDTTTLPIANATAVHLNGTGDPDASSLALPSCTPMEMLSRALSNGAEIAQLKPLMDLQERWEARQARKAFDAALSQAKAEIPVIFKNRQVGFDSKRPGAARTSYRHEDLGEIARTIDPILGKYGLSYRWRTTSNPNEPVQVTCIISHCAGHSEENTLCAGRDDSGNKNSIQAIGSAITYLQRYTLKAALGLSASHDDDGHAAGSSDDEPRSRAGTITSEQALALMQLVQACRDPGRALADLLRWSGAQSIPDIPADRFERAAVVLRKRAEAAR